MYFLAILHCKIVKVVVSISNNTYVQIEEFSKQTEAP